MSAPPHPNLREPELSSSNAPSTRRTSDGDSDGAALAVRRDDDATVKTPAWYLGYFAVAILSVATLGASLALNYWQSAELNYAVGAHGEYTQLLEQIGDLRTLAMAVDAPANDVFLTHDLARESHRLEVNAEQFNEAFDRLRQSVKDNLNAESRRQIAANFPAIERQLTTLVAEARLVFANDHIGQPGVASQHMATMDAVYGEMIAHLMKMERTIMRMQMRLLAQQRQQATDIQHYGLLLLCAAIVMTVVGAIHARRVYYAMRLENASRERYTRALAKARDEAEQAAKIKAQFLANMSHEIRTPMNGVLGMLDALATTKLTSEQSKIIRTANASADLLLAIIDDILDFSKIEAGMLVIEKLPMSIEQTVQQVVSMYGPRAHEKSVRLRYEVGADVPPCVVADPTRIGQLLSNFVSNAIKFTAQGEVRIVVNAVETRDGAATLRFAVKDSGIGIAPESQSKLFSAFTQADNSTSRRFGGTGLGLAICRQIVSLLDPIHGKIGVISDVGQGAEFYFMLRLDIAPEMSDALLVPHSADESHFENCLFNGKVLLAEDNDTNQQVALRMLSALGLQATLAQDGAQAVAAVQSERFDVILMDYHMPQLDGCDAAREIRRWEAAANSPRTPIVAVTASVLKEDKERCVAAGMDDFLPKPIRQQTLTAMLAKWLPPSHRIDALTTSSTTTSTAMIENNAAAAGASVSDDLPTELFDVAQFSEMREIAGDGFATLLQQLHGNVQQGVQGMRAAIEARNADDLRRAAHKLKGSSATIGLAQLAGLCLQLEMLGKSGAVDGAAALIDQVIVSHAQARTYLDRYAHPEQRNVVNA